MAVQPAPRRTGRTDSSANPMVTAPQTVRTTTRNSPAGAVTAYMSLIEWSSASYRERCHSPATSQLSTNTTWATTAAQAHHRTPSGVGHWLMGPP